VTSEAFLNLLNNSTVKGQDGRAQETLLKQAEPKAQGAGHKEAQSKNRDHESMLK